MDGRVKYAPRARGKLEEGFMLIEVLAAVFILVVGLTATFVALGSSNRLALNTQRQQVGATLAEQALEQLRAMRYASLALSSLPAHAPDGNPTGDTSGNPSNPYYWVSGVNLLVPKDFTSETSGTLPGVAAAGEPLINGGTVSPGPDSVTVSGYTATVYRFISWIDDRCVLVPPGTTDLCVGNHDAKRVTVAVVLAGGGTGVRKPVWLSSVVANPQAGVSG